MARIKYKGETWALAHFSLCLLQPHPLPVPLACESAGQYPTLEKLKQQLWDNETSGLKISGDGLCKGMKEPALKNSSDANLGDYIIHED